MPTVELDGCVLHYEQDGDGDDDRVACLVLHGGLGLDHVLHRRALAPLADTLRLVYPDHRGNGRSVPVDLATMTIEQLADDAVALADHLGLDRFVVLGHSYGGFIAQELALRHPHRMLGLVLVDTTPGQLGTGERPEDTEAGPPMPPEVAAMMATFPTSDEELAEGMAALLPAYFHRPDRFDLEGVAAGTIHRVAPMVQGFALLSQWSSVDRLGEISIPTLVVAGRHDLFTSWPQAHRIADRLPDAEVVIFEDSGHYPFVEVPDEFFATVRRWLGEHGLS